jgi:GT2 family glycosyltransferase
MSLRRQIYRDFEVIVVDNGSSDDSVQFIQTNFNEVKIIRLPVNQGFCQAVNCGIKSAKGKYLALLNNDTETHPAWLEELVRALRENPRVGFCASKMLNFFQRDRIDNAGDRLSYYGYNVGQGEVDFGQYDRPSPVLSACAGAAIYRRELFFDTGLFDEDFFAYYEDIDLALRAQLQGYQCLYVPTAVVYHIHQATSNRIPAKQFFCKQRNIFFVHLKNMPFKLLLKILPVFLALHLFASVSYLRKTKDLKTVLKLYWHVLMAIPAVIKKRKVIQVHKTVPVSYIESVTGPFPHLYSYFFKQRKK